MPDNILIRLDDKGNPIDPIPPGYTFAGRYNPGPNYGGLQQGPPDWMQQHLQQFGQNYSPGQPTAQSQAVAAPQWDWQNPPIDASGKPIGPDGTPLAYGAERFDPWGRPYYGEGVQGLWKGFISRLSDPSVPTAPLPEDWRKLVKLATGSEYGGRFAPATMPHAVQPGQPGIRSAGGTLTTAAASFGMAEKMAEQWTTLGTSSPTLITYFGRLVKEIVAGGLSALQIPTEAAEAGFYGTARGLQAAGKTSALPALGTPGGPNESVLADVFNLNYGLLGIPYNLLRAVTAPISWEDKKAIMQENYQAARIAYSQLGNATLREEYIRRYRSGENPELLAMEMQNPVAELIGTALFDPTIALGLITRGFRDARLLNDANYALKVVDPDIAKALDAFRDVASDARAAGAVETLAKADNVVVAATKSPLEALAELDRPQVENAMAEMRRMGKDYSPWALTASGKRYIAAGETGAIASWTAANYGPDEAINIFTNMARSASADADEALAGLDGLLNTRTPRPFFSQAGYRMRIMLNKLLVNEEGVIDAEQFIKQLEGKSVPELAEIMGKKLDDIAAEMIPDVSEGRKAAAAIAANTGQPMGEHTRQLAAWYDGLSPVIKSLDRVQDNLQTVVGPINRFFAGIYMGMSPGYALRNALNNTFTVLVDQGPKVAAQAGATSLANFFKPGSMYERADNTIRNWLGGIETRGAFTGFAGPAEAVGVSKKGLFGLFAGRAEAIEVGVSKQIVANSIERTMRSMLRPGRALPDITPLLNAGMKREAAQLLSDLVVQHYGDVKAATSAFAQAAAVGRYDVIKNVAEWLSPNDAKALQRFGFFDPFQAAVKAAKEEGDLAKATGAIADLRKAVAEIIAKAAKEVPPVIPEQMPEALSTLRDLDKVVGAKHMTDEAADLLQRSMVTNSAVFRAYEQALASITTAAGLDPSLQRIAVQENYLLQQLLRAGYDNSDEFAAKTWGWSDKIKAHVRAGFSYKSAAVKLGLPQAARSEQGFFTALWKAVGLPDDEALIAKTLWDRPDKATNIRQAFLSYLWDGNFRPNRMAYWATVRQTYTDAVEDFFKLVKDYGIDADALPGISRAREANDIAKVLDTAEELPGGLLVPKTAAVQLDPELIKGLERDVNDIKQNLDELGRMKPEGGPAQDEWRAELDKGMEELRLAQGKLDEARKVPATARPIAVPYLPGTPPTLPRALALQGDKLTEMFDRVEAALNANWDTTKAVPLDTGLQKVIKEWGTEAQSRIALARLKAATVADATRDFALLNYNKKRYFDLALAYIMPYHFWYDRTYKNWLNRVVYNPEVISAYGRYRQFLEKEHAGMPEWWKYQINTNELLGMDSENPLYFNLEAAINPLNGITGVDFSDPYRRVSWWTQALDDLNKFGPSLWSPIQIATAIALNRQGETEAAARWGGRLLPQTAAIKSLGALLHVGPAGGPELDPATLLLAGGLDPYERNRIGRALGTMIQNGQITEAQASEAAQAQQGPIWDAAKQQAAVARAPGQLASFFFGTGFKPRSQQEVEIDRMYTENRMLWANEGNLSPDEFRAATEQLRAKYPFMDTVLLSRKGGVGRDRTYAYNVLSRIPPGQKDDIAAVAGIGPDLFDQFYATKGHMELWDKAERDRFMGAIADIGALLEMPDTATRQEWSDATAAYGRMRDNAEQMFGGDIWQRVDMYYAAKGDTFADQQRAQAILDADPAIGQALDYQTEHVTFDPLLQGYYGSIDKLRGYYKSQMYDAIDQILGKSIFDKWAEYYRLKDTGGDSKAYWKAHPELKQYITIRDGWDLLVNQSVAKLGLKLRTGLPAAFRNDAAITSITRQQLAGALGPRQQPNLSWDEWLSILPEPLLPFLGGPLPPEARMELEHIAGQLGLPPDQVYEMVIDAMQNQ